MTTNREWLYSLDVADLADWFDAEHAEHQDGALDGDTEPESEDSRERLEADISKYLNYPNDCRAVYDYNAVIGWLDRQAAITEEQTRCKWVTASAEEIAAWRSKAEKLKAQVYELTAERDDWKEHSRTIEYRCKKAETDCGIYRKKFGKCLDYADAIHALIDDEGMA